MSKRRLYCPLANKYCRQSAKKEDILICKLTKEPLSEYDECVREAIYKEQHKVELWFSKEGWQMRHLFMIGTFFEKENIRIVFDYNGIVIQNNLHNIFRIKNTDELKKLLPPSFPDWLITELSKRIKRPSNS